jgi:hypothetical protein
MLGRLYRRAPGRTLGALALAVAVTGVLIPNAAGVSGPPPANPARGSGPGSGSGDNNRTTSIVRVARDFTVAPHSLAINQLVPCPAGTQLTGGGTALIGEPSSPATAPVLYTNGPVGDIFGGDEQTWASEVANNSDETFTYRQFALCARSQRKEDEDKH